MSTGGSGSLVDRGDYDDGQVSQGSFDEDFGQFSQVAGGSQVRQTHKPRLRFSLVMRMSLSLERIRTVVSDFGQTYQWCY